jgi:hypothetical protein
MSDNALEKGFTETKAPTDTRSFADKLADEARLIWGSKDYILDGIKSGVRDRFNDPMKALGAFAVGAAAGALATNPFGRVGLYALSAVGMGTLVAPEVASVWSDRSVLSSAQKDLGTKFGDTLAYAPVAAVGAGIGMRVARVNWTAFTWRSAVRPGQTSTVPEQAQLPLSGGFHVEARPGVSNAGIERLASLNPAIRGALRRGEISGDQAYVFETALARGKTLQQATKVAGLSKEMGARFFMMRD